MPIPRPIRGRAVECALVALALMLALVQRPGLIATDTKIDLHVDPIGFLGDVLSAWSSTGDLGHVQGGQYGGYAFPMAPFFALGHLLGLPPWLVQRLWLALVLALAAWGAARLAERFGGGSWERAVAGALYLLNPYVVLFTNRTSVTLLAYAVLPWLLLVVHGGLREPRRWRAPAAFALLLAASGGGVNAAVTSWVLLGPLLLAAYEAWRGAVPWRALWSLGWRVAAASALVSAWWIAPLLVQSRFGVDFLAFTEQPGTIWSTTSLNESLRLMGYWVSYLGVGYSGTLQPYFGSSGVMLFSAPVLLAQLLLPALALAGLVWTSRRPYAPFCLALALAGLLVMFAGFPEGTPLRRGLTFLYNHVDALQFLRTTHKAGPLLALAIALLGGMAVAEVTRRRAFVALAGAALVVLSVWPLARGQAIEGRLSFERVPPAWEAAARHADATGGRALVLPGQLYANYDWGGTIDALLPAIADVPVATRFAVPYADLRATEALWTTDALVQQRRALPGQLAPLLDLLGARTVIAGADDNRGLSGAATAADAAGVLDQLGPPQRAWGRSQTRPAAAGTLGEDRALAQVRAWQRPGALPPVRVQADTPPMVVDGGADALAALAAFGSLPRPLVHAADVDVATIRRAREVVIADGNRRRVLVVSRLVQNAGATLAAEDPISEDAAVLNPFAERGVDAQTVAVLDGVASVRAPFSPGFPQFPERRPFAALDGDRATSWLADRALEPDRHWLEVRFTAPRDVPYVDLEPYSDRLCTVLAVEIAGRRYDVREGVNRLAVDLQDAGSLRVRIAATRRAPEQIKHCGGIRELAIPGLVAGEALRVPVVAERALAGTRAGLTYLFQRTTGDDPFRRDPWRGSATAGLVRDRGDGERGLERVFSPPVARTWAVDGWASVASDAPDPALDRLAGVSGTFASSARFQGRAGWRASSAFDGTARPWIGSWQESRTPWLEWTLARVATVRRLRIAAAPRVRAPRRVRLNGVTATVRGGVVTLARPVRARTFRLEILEASFPPGTPGRDRQARAVGIAELTGAGVPRVRVPRSGPLAAGCGDLSGTLGGRPVRLQAVGDIADLDAGRPLKVRGCGTVALGAGQTRLSLPPAAFAPYLLRLRSPRPSAAVAGPGRVVSAGRPGRGSRSGIRLDLRAPATLVVGEAFNRGWRATCDGQELGEPHPADGYALGWRVPRTCREVELAFAPNRLVTAAGILSAIAAAALLVIALRRRPRPRVARPAEIDPLPPAASPPRAEHRQGPPAESPPLAENRPRRLTAAWAALAALLLAPAFGFVFAARATPLFSAGLFMIFWRAVPTRALLALAGGLLVVAVPVLTLLIEVDDRGGYNPDYAGERVAVHWVAVAAVALLIVALGRLLISARGRRAAPGRSRAPTAPPAPGSTARSPRT